VNNRLNRINDKLLDQEALYKSIFERAKNEALISIDNQLNKKNAEIIEISTNIDSKREKLKELNEELNESQKILLSNTSKIQKSSSIYKRVQYAVKRYNETIYENKPTIDAALINEIDEFFSTTVELRLHYMDVRQLKALFTRNKKNIKEVLEKYKSRYTTKTNIALYSLMVIALESELQNILYNLKFGKIEDAINNIKSMSEKYQKITSEGNQSIAPTMTKFIGEIEYLYIEAVKIEYEYYIKKENIKEEQRALREQMRQEAEECKRLVKEREKIEKEEEKYNNEISSINNQIEKTTDEEKIKELQDRILEIQKQLTEVESKKEELIKLQHGKAGYVYIISNLGAFGDNVFKIGMTRRLDPQERINELSGASVPFPFDVHSFIFSNDAVDLENDLHKTLNNNRLNKINLRKEFFKVTLEQLEEIIYSIQPTVEFKRTLLAEQYYQSMSVDEVPNDLNFEDMNEDDYVEDEDS